MGRCPGRYGWLSLVTLVVQGCMHSLVLRVSRTVPGPRYLASVAVILTEAAKIMVCLGVLLTNCVTNAKSHEEFTASVFTKGRDLLRNSLPMSVPAGLYVMQQTLVIVAATHLDVITFQICSQLKVFPTAIFASMLLGQHLGVIQWMSLPVLAGGVSLVTGSSSSVNQPSSNTDWHLGVIACLVSGISSAFAGVWFEKYVKGAETNSLWIRNCQLSMYGLPLAVASLLTSDRAELLEGGFFQGFNVYTWFAIALQAFGGIVVGMVVKYADNILKNFANALSVICTVLAAIPIFGQYPSPWSLLGLLFTFTSIFMYGNSAPGATGCCWGARDADSAKEEGLPLKSKAGARDEASPILSCFGACGSRTLMQTVLMHKASPRKAPLDGSLHRDISAKRAQRWRYVALAVVLVAAVGMAAAVVQARENYGTLARAYRVYQEQQEERGQALLPPQLPVIHRARLVVRPPRSHGHATKQG
eukprot:jgi/Tetstr1/466814/TSEL_011284.t1